VSRKLLAGATSLLLVTALLSGSAMAGQLGARPAAAKGDVTLTHVGAAKVPFARQTGMSSMAAKPARPAVVSSVKLQSTRKGKLESGLADKLAKPDAQSQKFAVLVSTHADADSLRNVVRGMEVTRTFTTAFSGFAARLTAQQIRQLQGLAQIESISLDQAVTADIDSAEKWTGVQKAREAFRITGDRDGMPSEYSTDDVVVAIIDTGIDVGHRDLAGKVVGWADMINGETEPYDDYGHGTHVAGIAAGAGVANRSMRGVAPGAALVGVKVLDENGSGSFSSVIAGIEWVIDNKDAYNIRVLKTNFFKVLPIPRG
jgi:serine protease AprX